MARRPVKPAEVVEVKGRYCKPSDNRPQVDQWDTQELQTNWFEYWSQFLARWERP